MGTADRFLLLLPEYYWGEPLIERILAAWASEIERLEAVVDQLGYELLPANATDGFGLLAMWEKQFDVETDPATSTVEQRQGRIVAALQSINANSSAETLAALATATDGVGMVIQRDTPATLQDTIQVPFTFDSPNAGVIARIARRLWPAHRRLFIEYEGGFLFDTTPFDVVSA